MALSDGMQVQIRGALTVYEARGQYQLNVQLVQAGGAGLLQAKFEANRNWIFLLPFSLFWGTNALLGVLLFLGKSFARICIGIEVLLFVAFLILTIRNPGMVALRSALMLILAGIFFAGILLWPRRQIRNQLVPAN